ncbi:MAG: aminoacyl-tRNA hydrolase [Zetaproteobacteria bacterium]|nr:MAG: aminoacyl-tRNA hydrolase [Zetaproteobacteria bacterium]
MWLFVGLGNPGREYERNRHNVGFMLLDAIQNEFPVFGTYKSKFQGKISEGRLGNQKVLLLKPETYMNNSGQSVVKAANFYKIAPDNVIVFHDEIDIAQNAVRVKQGGGNAGHNGLKSIQAHLSTADFWRVRVGIGRPSHQGAVSNYVLDNFSKAEQEWLGPLLDYMGNNADTIISDNPKAYDKLIKEYLKT